MTTVAQYKEIQIRGLEAVQDNKGGYVFQGKFYYPAATNVGIICVEAKDWVATVESWEPEVSGSLALGA